MDYYESKGISPSAAFFILLGLMGAGLLVGGVAGAGAWMAMTGKGIYSLQTELMNPLYVNAARWMQVISVLFMFFFPALIVARLIDRRPLRWLGFSRGFNSRQFILVVVILAACMPLVGALGELNQAIPLTRNLEQAVKKMEENYTTQATALATMRSFPAFIFSLIVMALLPAVFEETFFRGGVQQILLGWFKSPLAAILITSILFSAMHISWFGFLPRFALGMVLGYIFYYSKSIWLNMV
jgi:membrane protease YdiL (CAAX protease family)